MKYVKVKVTGTNAAELVSMFAEDEQFYNFKPSDDVYVFTAEEFYLRNNSQVMACIIVKLVNEQTLLIDIISGGGRVGFLRLDSGAEEKWIKKIAIAIEAVCEQQGWQIEKNL
ncbi:hypothetical protein [Desulfuribacillus alkaliarsenatis]|uniref:Uncharacterized protein n=1 Tax=Desulfuribacillus alkaliarsenatis TaxID=766136 RepID=A0A1E5G010_9FIRM|nr:hypothetical protein [Desulfuribacillus alkaliarsenatis]OEF95817.1 hypothetical protein BHF68_10475 [Desulfuribacillus alkaliarsenatis]